MITWITGNSGAGKTTLAKEMVERAKLHSWSIPIILDGDALRAIWPGLGFEAKDRWENNLRAARLAKELESQGFDVIVSTICPYIELRKEVQRICNCKFIYLNGGKTGTEYPYEYDI